MAERVDAGHRLLAQVAALGETNGEGIAAELLRQILVRDVRTEERRAGFDTGHLQRLMSAGHGPRRYQGRPRSLDDRGLAAQQECLRAADVYPSQRTHRGRRDRFVPRVRRRWA